MDSSILDTGTHVPQAGLVSIGKLSAATGLHEQTIRRLDQHLPSFLLPSGHRRYNLQECLQALRKRGVGEQRKDEVINGETTPILCVIRVSTTKESQKTSLIAQRERLTRYVSETFGNVPIQISWNERTSSGLNLSHPKVLELIDFILSGKLNGGFLICTFKDRLCRYGWEIFERLCQLHNISLRFIDELDQRTESEELQSDLLSILTVFTAKANGDKFRKLYGVKINEETAKLILSLHSQKLGHSLIAQELEKQEKNIDENGRLISGSVVARWIKKNAKVVRKLQSLTPVSSASSLNSFQQFSSEKLLKNEDTKAVRFTAIYDAYQAFCRANLLVSVARNTASQQLRDAGFTFRLRNGFLVVYTAIRR